MPGTAKGLLTAGNSQIAFIDVTAPVTAPVPGLLAAPLQNSLMLAQVALLPGQAAMVRTSMSAWDDRAFVDAVHATACGKLILAGVGTATFVALPALQATHDGYEVYWSIMRSWLCTRNGGRRIRDLSRRRPADNLPIMQRHGLSFHDSSIYFACWRKYTGCPSARDDNKRRTQ
jgi:hypothetical protein